MGRWDGDVRGTPPPDAEVRDVYRTLARQWRELAVHREADIARRRSAGLGGADGR